MAAECPPKIALTSKFEMLSNTALFSFSLFFLRSLLRNTEKYPAQTLEVAGDLRRAPASFENPGHSCFIAFWKEQKSV